ncbi:plastocyanin/azurin family copper-binding protein [Blastopirellula sp. JC732]|uniref:Plastocyanin/azurin family copper-binding protein n=1 Tax=Blastopirellula sediminis TaxID=2894196 RepID=A0A9X1SL81_9BACT|nr:plastocyanin/azurin family copper-binding protein [Blastopirellula sediminis]MCC9606298.1 plastocyanin/azurin family copper-binding protein [Blastopirellula sediminis]MCC9630404.1 plastocyanin/azurin family copper-binding protein [Blastopirellula sediminis]
MLLSRRCLFPIAIFCSLLCIARPSAAEENPTAEVCAPGQSQLGPPIPETFDPQLISAVIDQAQQLGDVDRGIHAFRSAKFACVSCHQIDGHGGVIGPNLTDVGKRLKPEQIVEAIYWPSRTVPAEFNTWLFQLADGQVLKGYKRSETDDAIEVFDPATQKLTTIDADDLDAEKPFGTLMPAGVANSMSDAERRDLVRFLTELGKTEGLAERYKNFDQPSQFAYDRAPLNKDSWNLWQHPVNRDRIYDFYRKEGLHFREQANRPHLLPAFPGLDGGDQGHWGNQNEATWSDDRWSKQDKSPVLAGVTRLPGRAIPKGVCVQVGDQGELTACFNPQTLAYEATWRRRFVTFSGVRHGFMDGLRPAGPILTDSRTAKPAAPHHYHGYYRIGSRVAFAYRIGDDEILDAPWVGANGQLQRQMASAADHPLATQLKQAPTQWPEEIVLRGQLGDDDAPYAIDTIPLPYDNPYGALMFISGHDFLSDGTAVVSTMTGDVWLVSGLDAQLQEVRWKRFASGLHQPLGVVVADDQIYVLGRDQITRLVDLNDDREADFYECVSNAYATSTGGHDFICDLARDKAGNFYTASSQQGAIRISADGKQVDVLATGFRNPDGIGLCPDGAVTIPCSEGEWTPASMICLIEPGQDAPPHFGYRGPQQGKPPALPLVYLPRGLDNSSGGQAIDPDERFGPLAGQIIHTSLGAGSHFLVLRDKVRDQPQGAVIPLPGNFRSGVHRAKHNPHDGQLYVSGMAAWGSYTPDDGCLHRVRWTGKPMQIPTAFHIQENGVLIDFAQPIDPQACQTAQQFAQAWNYRYGPGYGSPELAPGHPGVVGHESLRIAGVHPIDHKKIFVEIPDLQPVNQLHLLLQVDEKEPQEIFVTVHELDAPYTNLPGYRAMPKTIAAHPLLTDLELLKNKEPNPWQEKPEGAQLQSLAIAAGPNLTFSMRTLTAKPGETIALTFTNPDVVPHNWVLIQPGTLEKVGDLANKFVANPAAVLKQYVPASEDVIAYTDIVPPGKAFTIYFPAPKEPGRYPYLCTFPGHWMVMNGELVVE